MKRYRLLKDLPGFLTRVAGKDLPAGTLFLSISSFGGYSYYPFIDAALCQDIDLGFDYGRVIEETPDWFEEVKEEPELQDRMKLSYLRRAQQKGLEGHAAEVWAALMTLSDRFKPNSWEDTVFANATCLILDQNAKDSRR